MLVTARDRAAAVLDAADMILRHLVGGDRLELRLDDLTDLFLDRHLRQQGIDPALDRRIKADRRTADRPGFGMDDTRSSRGLDVMMRLCGRHIRGAKGADQGKAGGRQQAKLTR